MAYFGGSMPQVLTTLLQQGFLAREMEEGLDSILGFRKLAVDETIPGRIGETLTRTRKGRKVPIEDPLIAQVNDLDNGLTPTSAFSIEQYTFTLQEYADTVDLDLMADEAAIASSFIANARNNGVQAAQTQERICRNKIYSAYMGGSTRVIVDPGAGIVSNSPGGNPASILNSASGQVHLDDIRGFQTLLANGVRTAVSAGNPLAIEYASTSGGITITAATPYVYQTGKSALDITNTPKAIPGFVTIANASGGTLTITADAAVLALNGPRILRIKVSDGTEYLTSKQIATGDKLKISTLLTAVAYLRDNGVPPQPDGTFHVFLDNTAMLQLYEDSVFQSFYRGRADSPEWREADIVRILGLTLIPTTETYVQLATGAAINKPTVKVRRALVAGAESVVRGSFEGMETFLSERGFDRTTSELAMVDGVLQIVRPPLDRLSKIVAQTWTWIGDYAVPSDVTANASIIPTGGTRLGNPEYKRACVVEFQG